MAKPDLEQNLGQELQPQRTRRIPSRGVGLDADGVWRYAGEPGGPPGSNVISGDQLEVEERRDAELMNQLYESFLGAGYSKAEARRLAGID